MKLAVIGASIIALAGFTVAMADTTVDTSASAPMHVAAGQDNSTGTANSTTMPSTPTTGDMNTAQVPADQTTQPADATTPSTSTTTTAPAAAPSDMGTQPSNSNDSNSQNSY